MKALSLSSCLGLAVLAIATTAGAAPPRPKPPPKPKKPAAAATAAGTTPAVAASVPDSSVAVSVVEVAGDYAYLKPGESGGVRRGSRVVIREQEYRVIAASAAYAVVDAVAHPPRERDSGTATVVAAESDRVAKLAPPKPLQSFERVWPESESPASKQVVQFVPLGSSERDRRWDVRLAAVGGGLFPLGSRGSTLGRAELQARVHAEPFSVPLALDVDVAVQRWFASDLSARSGGESRPLLRVRELQLGYGKPGSYYAALGRMRYAASTLGALDGTRVRVPVAPNLTVGAFGGVVPHPLNGGVSTAAQRFGVEANYSDRAAALRPEAALVVQGSTYDAALDERRLMGVVGIFPGLSRLGGHFELSGFDKTNPWNASPIELSAAGLDSSVRLGLFQLGARVDLRQQERSRWLASFLPSSWLCTSTPQVPAAGASAEPCASTSTRGLGAVDGSVELGPVAFMVGGTAEPSLGKAINATGAQYGAFAHGRVVRILRVARLDASASVSKGPFIDMVGVSGGPGVSVLGDRLDVSSYYRQATLQYRLDNQRLTQRAVGGLIMFLPSAEFVFTVQGEGMKGDDADALLFFASALWRPRL